MIKVLLLLHNLLLLLMISIKIIDVELCDAHIHLIVDTCRCLILL